MSANVGRAQGRTLAAGAAEVDGRTLFALGLGPFLGVLILAALPPLFPAIAADLEVGLPALGQVQVAILLLSAGIGLVVGPLADRHGQRRLLMIAALSGAASLIGAGLAPSFPALLLAVLIGSLAAAAL